MKSTGIFAAYFALLTVAVWVHAQDEPEPPGVAPEPPAKTELKPGEIREQTIYVPYAKLRGIFEKEGRGVFLPYDKFQELWQAARKATAKPDDDAPPFAAILTEIDSEATVQGDVLNVKAKAQIEVIREGWHEIPLRLQDAALRSAKLGDAPARILSTPDRGHVLLVEKKGKEPQRLELTLEYAKAFTKSPGSNSVSFAAPQAPVNRWKVRVPEAGVKINVQPMLAATQPTADDAEAKFDPAKETLVLAFVGAAAEVKIDWTAKSEGAAGLEALVNVKTQQTVIVDEGIVRARAQLNFEISRAELSQIFLEIPADFEVKSVFDANVKGLDIKKGDGGVQTVVVTLHQPAKGNQSLAVEMESVLDEKKDAAKEETEKPRDIKVPYVKVVPGATKAAVRQQGIVLVQVAAALRAEVGDRTGLMQFDAAELPENLKQQPWTFSYRYSALPFGLTLQIEKVKPQLDVAQLVEVYLEPDQLTIDWLGVYTIERAGVFQLELKIPEGMEVRRVEGRQAGDAQPVVVDSHHVAGEKKDRLQVNLARRALGKVALYVDFQKQGGDPNLAAPTGQKSKVEFAVPQAVGDAIVRARGGLILYAPESLSVETGELKQLQPSSPAEAMLGLPSLREGRFPATRQTSAFVFAKEPALLSITAKRQNPQVTVREFLSVKVEPAQIQYDATFFIDVLFSGVKSLRIDVPQGVVKAKLRNQSSQYNLRQMTPQPDDVAKDYVAHEVTGGKEIFGSHALHLSWTQDVAALEVGKPVTINVPRLSAEDVSRFWGQIVVAKAEDLEVDTTGTPKGLRPIDPQRDLMSGGTNNNAVRAFEFHEAWTLSLSATRYELQEVKRTSIDRAAAQFVVTRGGELAVQVLYRVRTARQRLAIKMPSGIDPKKAFDSQPLRINGLPVSLEYGQDRYFVPLAGRNAEEPFVLELRYTGKGNAGHLELPSFPEDPAVQKVFAAVYLPQNRKLLSVNGPWTQEGESGLLEPNRRPLPFNNEQALLNWIREGVPGADQAGMAFPVDGDFRLFSTLRPPPDGDGALRLSTAHEYTVYALTFLVFAGVGLGLATQRVGTKALGLAAAIVAVVLLAVFFPTFARALWNPALSWAVALVAIVWTAQGVVWCANHCPTFWRTATVAAATTTAAGAPPAAGPDEVNIVARDLGQPAVPPPDTSAGDSSRNPQG